MKKIHFLKIISLFFIAMMSFDLSQCFAQNSLEEIFVCRSSNFANEYWEYLNERIPLNKKINREYINDTYDHLMRDKEDVNEQREDQCIWIEGKELSFFVSDGHGTLAITDGVHDIWFKDKASFGWINSQFFVFFKENILQMREEK
ncbi:hypothetical protein [Acetobacter sp.]|uniref:hypothetical protein n=1 Tax=Acetobacter sp. TaxID=440 RepID=UPI0039EAF733